MAGIGLQLYTVRDHLQKDFAGTLKRVADIGYRNLELAGYGGMAAQELRRMLADLGLNPVSSHAPLFGDANREIEYARELGASYIVCPWLPEELRRTADDYRAVGGRLAALGETCAAAGLTLCYHNHAFEFETKGDGGEYGYDLLFGAASADRLRAELDVYWVERAGLRATDYISRLGARSPLLHLKDMAADAGRSFAELGAGALPLPDIIAAGEKAGAQWMFVEQDVCKGDSLESAAVSFAYLKRTGKVS